MKKLLIIPVLLFTLTLTAQKEASNWFFGNFAGIRFLDDGTVETLPGSAMETNEGCSSISDSNGNLLFYTDGRNVWDRNHVLMPNGNYVAGTGLLGDPSSTQSGIIVPNKNNPDIYYIFTVDEPHHQNAAVYPDQYSGIYGDGGSVPEADDGYNNGLNYSVVDLSIVGENGSIGNVTTRNVHLITYDPDDIEQAKYKCSEKITAVGNDSGDGYWVITHFINKFYSFEVTAAGVNETPLISELNPIIPTSGYRRNSIGCIKASPDGEKITIAHVQQSTITGSNEQNGIACLYNFDNATGLLSAPIVINGSAMPYGVEFSPNSKKLYVSYDNNLNGFGGVHQYDLLSADIPASGIMVANTVQSGTLQLGPNGKIYRAVVNSPSLDVINTPDEDGVLCDYASNGQTLDSGTCFFGLPPFITSYFSASITATDTCLGQATQFELNVSDAFDSVSWNFGDGSAPSTATSPTHTYAATGTYNVVATILRAGETSVVSSTITITPVPVANAPLALTECDPEMDGVTVFTLSENTPVILGTQNPASYTVKYYANEANAEAGTLPLNDAAYTNIANPQTIYARIESNSNPNCYTITDFTISTLPSPQVPATDEATVCLNIKEFITLKAVEGNIVNLTFSWSTGATTPTIQVNAPGTYTVTVSNNFGCSNTKTITVKPSDIAVINDIIVKDLRDNNTVTVLVTPANNVATTYMYSINKPSGPFQTSNVFENVPAGVHTVYVYDSNGCGVTEQEIAVLSIPKFFTPNADGINDTWDIIGINTSFYGESKIFIFDRYGKLLADVDPRGPGWDGTYDGYKLPATDYWYVVKLDNGRTVKGHFSIIK